MSTWLPVRPAEETEAQLFTFTESRGQELDVCPRSSGLLALLTTHLTHTWDLVHLVPSDQPSSGASSGTTLRPLPVLAFSDSGKEQRSELNITFCRGPAHTWLSEEKENFHFPLLLSGPGLKSSSPRLETGENQAGKHKYFVNSQDVLQLHSWVPDFHFLTCF